MSVKSRLRRLESVAASEAAAVPTQRSYDVDGVIAKAVRSDHELYAKFVGHLAEHVAGEPWPRWDSDRISSVVESMDLEPELRSAVDEWIDAERVRQI